MVDIEVLQKSFMDSMDSMRKTFEKEKEVLEQKVKELKEDYAKLKTEKKNEGDVFEQTLKGNSLEINRLKALNRDLKKQLETNKNNDSTNNKEGTEELNQYKTKNDELNKKLTELNNKNEKLITENKKINDKNKLNEQKIIKYEEEINSLKELKPIIEQLNTTIKDLEKQISNEQEEKNRIITEKKNLDNDLQQKEKKINELNEQIKISESKNKELLENIKKLKEEEEIRIKEIEKSLENSLEKKNKFLTDILCEFLIKLNNSPHFISVFDLLNKSLKYFDEFNYFAKFSLKYSLPLYDISFIFYSNLRSYILLHKDNASFKNFLSQKIFTYSEINKDDIMTLKIIRDIKLNDDTNLLDLYKKKKDLFVQKFELTFDLLKNKILSSFEEDIREEDRDILYDSPDLLKILEPPINLDLNLDTINFNKLGPFITFQINNSFNKLEHLSIEVSIINLDVFYSIIFNCKNLKSIKIKLNDKNDENNIIILDSIIPILFNNNKSLIDLSYINVPLLNQYLPKIVTSIKNSKLEKLSLSGCFNSKADLAIFNSFFSSENYLTEINFSNNNFNIPSLLANSLFNYEISKKLTAINFSYCDLSEDDFNVLAKYLEENPLVKVCDLSENTLEQKSCFKLGIMLDKNTTLEKLNLMNCKLNEQTITCIFSSKGSKGLKHLILNFNPLGDLGLIGISAFLKNSPKLEILELVCVSGNDIGFSNLINCVKVCESLKVVHFVKNNITKMSIDIIKNSDEELKNKHIKFFLDKIEGEKNMENTEVFEFI